MLPDSQFILYLVKWEIYKQKLYKLYFLNFNFTGAAVWKNFTPREMKMILTNFDF